MNKYKVATYLCLSKEEYSNEKVESWNGQLILRNKNYTGALF